MGKTAFSNIPTTDQIAILSQMGAREKTARKHLEQIGCDTDLLLFYLWCATNPQHLEGKESVEAQHAQHRSKLTRTKTLILDIEDLRFRLLEAATSWRAEELLAAIEPGLRNFVDRLKLNLELNKRVRVSYFVFLGPAISTIESSYARHNGTVENVSGCEKITCDGGVPPKYWKHLEVLLDACARARGTQLPLGLSAGATAKRVTREPAADKKKLERLFGSTSPAKTKST